MTKFVAFGVLGVGAMTIGLLASSAGSQQSAGRYRMYEGGDMPACQAILSHINATPKTPSVDGMCDVPLPSGDLRFSRPAWRTLGYDENWHAVRAMFEHAEIRSALISQGRAQGVDEIERQQIFDREFWPVLRDALYAGFERGEAKLQAAEFDVDNDGDADRVVRMTAWYVMPDWYSDKTTPAAERTIKFAEPCESGDVRFRYFRLEEMNALPRYIGLSKFIPFDGYLFQFEGKTWFGLGPLTFGQTRTAPSIPLSVYIDHDREPGVPSNSCGIIERSLAPEPQ